MNKPRFSFIVPAFNEEVLISECLMAIREQCSPDCELLVVDNNSTDQTASVAAGIADRVVFCEEQGISAARNCGAREARGELLCFLDADSLLGPSWLNAGRKRLETGGFFAVSGWNLFRERNPLYWAYYNSYHLCFYPGLFLLQMLHGGMILGNNLIIRKDTFLAAGGFPRFVGEDMKLSAILREQNVRTGFAWGMRASSSSRRFKKQGFLRVMALWLGSLTREIPEASYTLDHNAAKQKKVPHSSINS